MISPDPECGQLLAAEHRLKGDRNAHEEILQDSTGAPLDGRMRTRVWPDQTCASAVCEFTPASATAGRQSI